MEESLKRVSTTDGDFYLSSLHILVDTFIRYKQVKLKTWLKRDGDLRVTIFQNKAALLSLTSVAEK